MKHVTFLIVLMQTRLVVIEQILYTFLLGFFFIFPIELPLKQFRTNILSYFYYKGAKNPVWICMSECWEEWSIHCWSNIWNKKKMLPLMYKPRNGQNAMKTKGHATPRTPMQSLNWMSNYHDYPLYRNRKMGDTHYKQKIYTTR